MSGTLHISLFNVSLFDNKPISKFSILDSNPSQHRTVQPRQNQFTLSILPLFCYISKYILLCHAVPKFAHEVPIFVFCYTENKEYAALST